MKRYVRENIYLPNKAFKKRLDQAADMAGLKPSRFCLVAIKREIARVRRCYQVPSLPATKKRR